MLGVNLRPAKLDTLSKTLETVNMNAVQIIQSQKKAKAADQINAQTKETIAVLNLQVKTGDGTSHRHAQMD
jgi:hypothetical protein